MLNKKQYRVRNWKDYNEALVKRGSLMLWVSEEVLRDWHKVEARSGRGRRACYSASAIQCGLGLKVLWRLSWRATEGFLSSLLQLLGCRLSVPDYTTFCRRQGQLRCELPCVPLKPGETLCLVVDSSGLKLCGEGEWRVRQHGQQKRRGWRKIHVAFDAKTQEVASCEVSLQTVQDCQVLPALLERVKAPLGTVIGDGAYDRFSCYEAVHRRQAQGIFPPQHNASPSHVRWHNKKKASREAVAQRDEAIHRVRTMGRANWKVERGYHRRSLAETGMFRLKQLFGDRLSSRLLTHQQAELTMRCGLLNRMTQLGMPHSVAC